MQTDQIKDSIVQWMKEFAEAPHPLWNDMPPCPYAKSARLKSNGLDIVVQGTEDYYDSIRQGVAVFKESVTEVMLIVAHTVVDPIQYTQQINEINQTILSDGLILLTDHPAIVEFNHGVSVQQGTYVITFIQHISTLLAASKQLHKTAYYDNWEPSQYKSVVTDRFIKCGMVVPQWAKQK